MWADAQAKLAAGMIVAIAVIIPWLTWWTLTTPNPHMAVTETPIFLSGIGLLLVLCVWVSGVDPWLGLLAAYIVVRSFPSLSPFAFEAAYLTVLGAMALVSLSMTPKESIPYLRCAIVLGGVAQVGYGIVQYFGHDPIWVPWAMGIDPGLDIRGTLGNRNFYGAYAAICLLLGPVWLMPVFVVGLVLAKSVMPVLACAVGLVVRFRSVRTVQVAAGVAILAAVAWVYVRNPDMPSIHHRLDIWAYAVKDWLSTHAWLGWGTGQWPNRIPAAHLSGQIQTVSNAVFVAAHNDWLQLAYEGGLIGLFLLVCWCYRHRAMLVGEQGGAVAAVAVNAFGNFPFHVGTTALLALLVLGLACAEERTL